MARQYFQAQYEADQADSLPGLISSISLIILILNLQIQVWYVCI